MDYLFGGVDDMEQIYWYVVKNNLVTSDSAFFLHGIHGISSGTAITVSSLSKWDRKRIEKPNAAAPAFVAPVAVSRVLSRDRFCGRTTIYCCRASRSNS